MWCYHKYILHSSVFLHFHNPRTMLLKPEKNEYIFIYIVGVKAVKVCHCELYASVPHSPFSLSLSFPGSPVSHIRTLMDPFEGSQAPSPAQLPDTNTITFQSTISKIGTLLPSKTGVTCTLLICHEQSRLWWNVVKRGSSPCNFSLPAFPGAQEPSSPAAQHWREETPQFGDDCLIHSPVINSHLHGGKSESDNISETITLCKYWF